MTTTEQKRQVIKDRITERRVRAIEDQVEFINGVDYYGYDRESNQSDGSVAVVRADVTYLLDLIDVLSYADATVYASVDTDDMQITVENNSKAYKAGMIDADTAVALILKNVRTIADLKKHNTDRITDNASSDATRNSHYVVGGVAAIGRSVSGVIDLGFTSADGKNTYWLAIDDNQAKMIAADLNQIDLS